MRIKAIMATCSNSCLISVKQSSSSKQAGGTSDPSSSTADVRPLSASGFFFRSFIISSASWLASLLVDVRLDSRGSGGTATWSWKVQPQPEFVILYQEDQEMKSAPVKCVGVFLMPSVLVALEESLSSLSHWRAAVSGHHHTDDEITDHNIIPLKSLLLPLACVAVFETNLSPTQSGWQLELCHIAPSVGSSVFVSATPFASYCPEVFLNSVMSGCVSKLLGSSGSVFLLDASTVPGCEGGMVVHEWCSKSSLNSSDKLCGMVLSSLTSGQGQPTGLSLACSSSAITEALQLVRAVSTPRDTHLDSDFLKRQSSHVSCIDELEKLIVLLTTGAGWGTGIHLTPSLVLTCSHVVQSKQDLMAHNTTTGEATRAMVVYSSRLPDLALLKLDKPITSNHTFMLESDMRQRNKKPRSSRTVAKVCKGMEVVAIGFGLRHGPTNITGPLVSKGVVSKVVHDMTQPVMLVTTAAVNPGMSGGLVANAETGSPLGMVISNSQVEDKGTLHPKINYCLPLSWILPALASYASDGELLQMQRLEEWGQKVKHLWQLQSSLGMHPMRSKL